MSSQNPPTEIIVKDAELLMPEPKEPSNKHRLNADQKAQVIHLIAQGYSDMQISSICKDKHSFTIEYPHLYYYRYSKKWKDLRKSLKNFYTSRPDVLESSRKDARVRRLEYIQDEALKQNDLRAAISTNEQIRKEFTGEDGGVNIYMNNPMFAQFNSLSNEELEARYRQALNKLALIQKESPNGSSGTSAK